MAGTNFLLINMISRIHAYYIETSCERLRQSCNQRSPLEAEQSPCRAPNDSQDTPVGQRYDFSNQNSIGVANQRHSLAFEFCGWGSSVYFNNVEVRGVCF